MPHAQVKSRILSSSASLRAGDVGLIIDAVGAVCARAVLRWLLIVVIGSGVCHANVINIRGGDAGERGRVAVDAIVSVNMALDRVLRWVRGLYYIPVVVVDPSQLGARRSSDAVHDDVTFVHGVTVAARTVQLAKVVDDEVGDGERTGTVVLQDLVIGPERAPTRNLGGVAGVLVLDGEGILANGAPPNVGESASSLAVNTFDLVRADDDVGEAATLLDLLLVGIMSVQ